MTSTHKTILLNDFSFDQLAWRSESVIELYTAPKPGLNYEFVTSLSSQRDGKFYAALIFKTKGA